MTSDRSIEEPCEVTSLTHGFEAERRGRPLRLGSGLRGANRSHPNEDKHKAPSSTPPHPLSLQDPGPQAPQWIGFPDSVVNIHQVSIGNRTRATIMAHPAAPHHPRPYKI